MLAILIPLPIHCELRDVSLELALWVELNMFSIGDLQRKEVFKVLNISGFTKCILFGFHKAQ